MHKIIRPFFVFFTVILLLSSCAGKIPLFSKRVDGSAFHIKDANIAEKGGKTEEAIASAEMVRVGVLLPLTGNFEKLGEALRNAAMMSLFDVGSQRLILQFYDTEGTAEGARKASELAINQGAELIIGPVYAKAVRAVRPATHSADVGVITFSSDPVNLGDGVYTISTLTSQQVEHIVRFACEKGYKRFAVLSQDNAVGDIVSMAAKAAVDACGGMITKAAFYDPKTDDLQSAVASIMPRLMEDLETERDDEVKRLEKAKEQVALGKPVLIKNEETGEMEEKEMSLEQLQATIDVMKEQELVRDPFEFDAILVPEEGSRLRSLGALFSYYDVPSEIRILGTSQWADSKPAREPALIGGWFSHLPSEGFAVFAGRYKDIYGEKPPRIASQAYDAVALAAILAETGSFSFNNLTAASGFKGVDGLFRLLPNGLSERGLQVLGVEKKGTVTLSPAAEVFETAPMFSPDVYIKDFRHSPDLITMPVAEGEEQTENQEQANEEQAEEQPKEQKKEDSLENYHPLFQ
ncbi:MAG: penicillin-binding protein activator [Alphaproteobacteria bacterium]|nr:penicillin-binding protein activator [Alphaproteobacteria bacterium]